MKYSLINPPWSFEGSIYFGCREPHLPLEFGYSKALLEREGHEVQILDGQFDALSLETIRQSLTAFRPDFTVLTTAPSYLFWRCAPPELRVPMEVAHAIRDVAGRLVIVGPHASTTPAATLNKLNADAVVLGECEEILPALAANWSRQRSICFRDHGAIRVNGGPHASDMAKLPPLAWGRDTIERHSHHHHRFEAIPSGPGAEMEVSRGCPYHCTFCAKDNFRSDFRRRPLAAIRAELDGLIAQGIEYVYFIDEIFLPFKDVLELLAARRIKFGMQTRIDLWSRENIELAGRGGCVSIEAGVESITEEGREILEKKCKLSTEELTERLIYARQFVPFVQANLLASEADDPYAVEAWRQRLQASGVWANKPVPLFAYPGSPDYTLRWGAPDDRAWERAHEHYLNHFTEFSDIQERQPQSLIALETNSACND
jgi:B12-binding domain/radical SAM domain protein of rhizo-twelve system